jgi:hypothetical protein
LVIIFFGFGSRIWMKQKTSGRSKKLRVRSEDLMKKTRGKIDPNVLTKALIPHDMHRLWGRGS